MSNRRQYRDHCHYGGWMYETDRRLYHVIQTRLGYKVIIIPRAAAFMRSWPDGTRTWYYDWQAAAPAVGPWLTITTALQQCGVEKEARIA